MADINKGSFSVNYIHHLQKNKDYRRTCLRFQSVLLVLILVTYSNIVSAQPDSARVDTVLAKTPDYKLLRKIFAGQSVLYLGSIYGLSKSWYKNPLKKFRIKDDTYEWLQMDKMGHVYTSYQIARHTAEIYKKTGISKKQMLIYGAISGIIFQTPIEILDGFSPDYGFSPGDMIANITGSVIYLGQIALWDEIRIQPKFSFHFTSLAAVRPELLGSNYSERWLKDYNGQTYWYSASPKSFFKNSKWPSWLCISAGYGINNMVRSGKNESIELGYRPYRQYYLSLDIDLTKIKTRSKAIRTICFMANSIKIPAPAIQISKNGIDFKPLYF